MQPQENPCRVLLGLHGDCTEGFFLTNLYRLEWRGVFSHYLLYFLSISWLVACHSTASQSLKRSIEPQQVCVKIHGLKNRAFLSLFLLETISRRRGNILKPHIPIFTSLTRSIHTPTADQFQPSPRQQVVTRRRILRGKIRFSMFGVSLKMKCFS